MDLVAFFVALLAALLFAVGAVMQQRAAAEVPDEDALGVGLITRLIRRPIWLIGTAADSLGYVAQAVALAFGSLLLVQPLLASMLLFALPLGAMIAHRRLRVSDGVWAVVLTAGLAIFLIAGDPSEGIDNAPFRDWIPALVVIVPVTLGCLLVAVRSRGAVRAVALASATGILYGVAAAYTKTVMGLLDEGIVPVITSWETYVLIAAAGLGTYLQQSAFQAGDLGASLPAASVLEPVVGVGLGIAVLQEDIRADGLGWILIGVAAAAMVAGTVALARSQAASEEATAAPAAAPEPAPESA